MCYFRLYLYFFIFFKICLGAQLLHNVVLGSATQQMTRPYIHMYPPAFGFPSQLGHGSALSRVPCVTQYVPLRYLFHTLGCT